MVPFVLKEFFLPGSLVFLLLFTTFGVLLAGAKGRLGAAGRMLVGGVLLFYWIAATPFTAMPLVRWLTPDYPPIRSVADARGATAVVVLGGGMSAYESRGATMMQGTREHSLRALEAARVYHLLDRPWVIVTGSLAPYEVTEAMEMAPALTALGVPADRIVDERKSRNTHDHTLYVPPLLAERGIAEFVLVTSRQHMARALRAFRRAGLTPVPSSPEFFVPGDGTMSLFLPSKGALDATSALVYDLFASVYYRLKGWA
jgi:uncharacterized SAM-binding protein YcdF (DUF218 family)